MSAPDERFVPKVHPATRPAEPDDPFTLHATAVGGDPEVMLRCMIQEYAWLGWNSEEILSLFPNPLYPALRSFWEYFGATGVQERVRSIVGTTPFFHLETTGCEDLPLERTEPELLQLSLLQR
jgi:hypothetical protein